MSLTNFSLAAIKNSLDEVRAQVYPRNETERKVYEALSSKNWGASTTLLNEIAAETMDYEKHGIVMNILWASLETEGKSWKQIFKSLTLLEFLVKNGAERIIEACRDKLYKIRSFQDFNFYEGTIDKGSGVREKAKQLIELLGSNEMIRNEREKARALRNKFVGIDSRNAGGGGGGGSYGGYGGGGGGGGGNDSYYDSGRGSGSSYDNNGGGNTGRYGGESYSSNSSSRYGEESYSNSNSGNSRENPPSRYGGGAYESDRPSRYGDEVPKYDDSRDNRKPRDFSAEDDDGDSDIRSPKTTPTSNSNSSSSKSKTSSSSSASTGGKLKVAIKKDSKAAAGPTALSSVPELNLLGDSEPDLLSVGAPAPAPVPVNLTSSTPAFDPFMTAPSPAYPAFDPFSVSPASTAQVSHPAPLAFDPFMQAPPPPVPAPVYGNPNPNPILQPQTQFSAFPPSPPQHQPGPQPGLFLSAQQQQQQQQQQHSIPFTHTTQPPPTTTTITRQQVSNDGDFGDFEVAPNPNPISGGKGAVNQANNSKWGDLGKLVDLSGIGKNEDESSKARAVKQQQGQVNNSFAGLDGFSKTPQSMSSSNISSKPLGMGMGMGPGIGVGAGPGVGMGAYPKQPVMAPPQQQQQQQQQMGMMMGGMPYPQQGGPYGGQQPMGGPYNQAPMMQVQGGMYPNPNPNMYGAPNPHPAMNMGMGMGGMPPQNPGNPMMAMGYPPQQQQQYGYPAPGQGAQPFRF